MKLRSSQNRRLKAMNGIIRHRWFWVSQGREGAVLEGQGVRDYGQGLLELCYGLVIDGSSNQLG